MPAYKRLVFLSLVLLLGVCFLVGRKSALAGYGEAGVAPVCTSERPDKPWLYYAEAVSDNQVKLVWDKNDKATSWTVAYGVESGKYIYGLSQFGDNSWRSITINSLPGGTYYFVVRANNGCMPGEFSNEQIVALGRRAAVGVGVPVTYKPGVTPTPSRRYVPETRPRLTPTPTPRVPTQPTRPTPLPTPRPSFFQSVFNFLFGWLFR